MTTGRESLGVAAGLGACLLLFSCTLTGRGEGEGASLTPVTAADIHQTVRTSGAAAVLVNLWATWCDPCREEFPGLVRVARKYRPKGLKVMFVSADDREEASAVEKFLSEHGVDFPSYIKAEKDQPFIDGLDQRWTGALPATILFDASGRPKKFWEGMVSADDLEKEVVEVLRNPERL